MSLFLAATSFARAVQLGGKGYAPAESDLRKHVKDLSDFVHFTDNLEEILGDNPNPSIRTALKGRASGDVSCSIHNETAKDLKEQIAQIHLSHRLQSASGTGISPARPRYHAINHTTAYGGQETEGPEHCWMKMLWHRHSGTRPSYSLWIRLFSVGRRGPACSYCSDPLRFPQAPLQNPCSPTSRSDKINSNPRPESEPSDLNLPARTRTTRSHPSTACWTSPASSRAPLVCNMLPSGPSLLWIPPLPISLTAEWRFTQRLRGKRPSEEARPGGLPQRWGPGVEQAGAV